MTIMSRNGGTDERARMIYEIQRKAREDVIREYVPDEDNEIRYSVISEYVPEIDRTRTIVAFRLNGRAFAVARDDIEWDRAGSPAINAKLIADAFAETIATELQPMFREAFIARRDGRFSDD